MVIEVQDIMEDPANGPGCLLMRRPKPPSKSYLNYSPPSHSPPAVKKVEKAPDVGSFTELHNVLDEQDLDPHSNFTIHPLHPKGPPYLPPGKIIHCKWYEPVSEASEAPPIPLPQFTLNDFLQNNKKVNYLKSKLERAAISRANYLKMTGWFATQQPTCTTLTVTQLQERFHCTSLYLALVVDHSAPHKRIPQHQMLLEFQNMLHDVIDKSPINDGVVMDKDTCACTSHVTTAATKEGVITEEATPCDIITRDQRVNHGIADNRPQINRAPTTLMRHGITGSGMINREPTIVNVAPSTMYQARYSAMPSNITVTGEDTYIHNSRSRIFCGQDRSGSPFDPTFEATISPGEVAILQCMAEGGVSLNLKAQFLSSLPDLQPLARSLSYINLSYNELEVFPVQLLVLGKLEVLHMRNNPLIEIPSTINILKRLKVLNISFNMLSDLPPGLFDLHELQELDVSHNKLMHVSPDISRLVMLERLNVSYNQLPGLPHTITSLANLTFIKLDNNHTHPLLWKENTTSIPQSLNDLCCHKIYHDVMTTPPHIDHMIQRNQNEPCDNCKGPIFGMGMRLVKASLSSYQGCRTVPFIYHTCGVKCHRAIKRA